VSQQIQHQSADVRVRRAPKFGAFMVVRNLPFGETWLRYPGA